MSPHALPLPMLPLKSGPTPEMGFTSPLVAEFGVK
jgi:hypothetical protein